MIRHAAGTRPTTHAPEPDWCPGPVRMHKGPLPKRVSMPPTLRLTSWALCSRNGKQTSVARSMVQTRRFWGDKTGRGPGDFPRAHATLNRPPPKVRGPGEPARESEDRHSIGGVSSCGTSRSRGRQTHGCLGLHAPRAKPPPRTASLR